MNYLALGTVNLTRSETDIAGDYRFFNDAAVFRVGSPRTIDGLVFPDAIVGESVDGIAVTGNSDENTGVYGKSRATVGVLGEGAIWGVKANGGDVGLYAIRKSVGVAGQSTNLAGYFLGPVYVSGPFVVFGSKSAAVPHPDGSHRLLYSVESPESWFEDFGEARLSRGKANVRLDPDFARLVSTKSMHIFLTPYDDSNGLYVARRAANGFEVREQRAGKSDLRFSFRVVAKRKDLATKRLAKVKLPALPPEKPSPKSQDRARNRRKTRHLVHG